MASAAESIIGQFLDAPSGSSKVQESLSELSLLEWAGKHVRLPKSGASNGRLDFNIHPYLRKPYEDYSVEQCYLKGAQLGFSTRALSKALWVAIQLGKSVIYTMPTVDDVTQFTAARINPIIESSAYLSERIMKIDSVSVKQFSPMRAVDRIALEDAADDAARRGDLASAEAMRARRSIGTIYFRGTGAMGGNRQSNRAEREASTADSDFNIHDELDRSNPRTREQYEERLTHSDLRWQEDLSTPKFPGQAIDRRWQISDKHVWLLRCPRCRVQFEMQWPGQPVTEGVEPYHNLSVEDVETWEVGDPVEYICHKCSRVIDNETRLKGEWHAMEPGKPVRGYRISQMSYVGMTARDLMRKFKEYSWKADFWNLVMALPFADRSENLSRELMLRAMEPPLGGNALMEIPDGRLTTMGIDVGKNLHVVIRAPHPTMLGRQQTVWLEEIPESDWSRLDQLMWSYNVLACVIDQGPEMTKAKDFALRHKGRVWMCSYLTDQRTAEIKWKPDPDKGEDDGDWTVKVDRTQLLDMDRDRFRRQMVGLPAYSDIVETYMKQSERVYRQPVFAASVGGTDTRLVERYQWVEIGPDHFRHASAYELLASMRWNPRMFMGGVTTVLLGAKTKEPQ